MKTETILYSGIAIIIIVSAFLIGYIQLNSTNGSREHPAPTILPTESPVFSVSMSPGTQNVVSDLGQNFKFQVTITGRPTYPCAITLQSDQSYQYNPPMRVYADSSHPSITIHPGEYGSPISSNGDSKTYSVAPIIWQSGGTASYYVSVVDSLGNRFRSNTVQVVFK